MEARLLGIISERVLDTPYPAAPRAREERPVGQERQAAHLDDLSLGQGEVIDEEMPLDRTQAQLFRAAGLRAPEGGWPDGRYEGRVTLLRGDRVLGERVVPIELGG